MHSGLRTARPDTAGSPSMSAISALRTATWSSHQRLEKRINFKARLATVGAYRQHLQGMWGFHAALEPRMASGGLREHLADQEVRRKLPLLERDLEALGADPDFASTLPRCRSLPHCEDPASAFGCAYVLEGATLGGRSLLPLVESRLGLTAETGAAYLASYGDAVEERWRAFGEALNNYCSSERHIALASVAAAATFSSLEVWLCGDPA
jgi:heme oxygenase (biliverdin-IX-beta and delta-forming)